MFLRYQLTVSLVSLGKGFALSTTSGSAPSVPVERSAERLAADLFANQLFQHRHLGLLVTIMPEVMFRSQRSAETFGGASFFTGSWVRGNLVGLSNHARDFPNITMYLVAFLKQRTSLPFASIGLVVGCNTAVRKDVHNQVGTSNILLPVRVSQGSLWVEDAGGTENRIVLPNHSRPGKIAQLCKDVVFAFDPKLHHQANLDGNSLVLVGYTPRGLQSLSLQDRWVNPYMPASSTEFWSFDGVSRKLVRHHPVPRTT